MTELWRVVEEVRRLEIDLQTYLKKAHEFEAQTRSYEKKRYTRGRISAYKTILKRVKRIMDRKPSVTV